MSTFAIERTALEHARPSLEGNGRGFNSLEHTRPSIESLERDAEPLGRPDPESIVREGLSEEEKARLQEETGWSDEILDAIGSKEEAEIYKDVGLQEKEIDGKTSLIREDIDLDQKDPFGKTNAERMADGKPPLDKDGKPIELHHIGQRNDAPLAELTRDEHRGKGNDAILHDKTKTSEIDRGAFDGDRAEHWKQRAA